MTASLPTFLRQCFSGLVSPEYLIELRRRMFAKADISACATGKDGWGNGIKAAAK